MMSRQTSSRIINRYADMVAELKLKPKGWKISTFAALPEDNAFFMILF